MNGNMNYDPYNGMNNMNNNMNPNMGMNPNMNMNPGMGMGNMQQAAMQDPLALEKKQKRLKSIKKLVIFIAIFVVLLSGKKYIDYITVDYKTVVEESLSKYYISTDIQDLEPIANLLNKYRRNAKIVKDIQNYSYEKIGEWFYYINDKYTCDEQNLNSCITQLKEFQTLSVKLKALKDLKGGGYFIILPTSYDSINAAADKKINELSIASKNRSAVSPDNSETIYQQICSTVKVNDDCECREGVCTCSYETKDGNGNKKIEEIKCYKPETIKEK